MSQTKVLEKKVDAVAREMTRVRSLLASFIVEDREGEYKASFVRRVLTAASQKPDRTFNGAESFLEELDKV